jgi:hypothetical protein
MIVKSLVPVNLGKFYSGSPVVWPGEGEVHHHRIFEFSDVGEARPERSDFTNIENSQTQ